VRNKEKRKVLNKWIKKEYPNILKKSTSPPPIIYYIGEVTEKNLDKELLLHQRSLVQRIEFSVINFLILFFILTNKKEMSLQS